MKKLLAVILTLFAFNASAALVYSDQNMTIVLTKEPCTNAKVLSLIEEPYRANFFAADMTYRGKPLGACWMPMPQQFQILMADETGDYGAVPMSAFKKRDDL